MALVGSGWTMLTVVGLKIDLLIVDTMHWVSTTVYIVKMLESHVLIQVYAQ